MDDCNDQIISGKQGQIYEYNGTDFAVMFMPLSKADPCGRWCPKIWNAFKRAAAELGMVLTQDGDTEGCLSFDPANAAQVKLAVKIAKVRVKKQVSDERKAVMVANLALHRSKAKENGLLVA